jgi:hypothetical protein
MTKITLDDEVPNVRSTTTADSEASAPAPSAPPAPKPAAKGKKGAA